MATAWPRGAPGPGALDLAGAAVSLEPGVAVASQTCWARSGAWGRQGSRELGAKGPPRPWQPSELGCPGHLFEEPAGTEVSWEPGFAAAQKQEPAAAGKAEEGWRGGGLG